MEFKKPALEKVWVLNTTWTDCPEEVKDEVRELWDYYELGNDTSVHKTSINDLREQSEEEDSDCPSTTHLIAYLESRVQEDEEVWLHFWW